MTFQYETERIFATDDCGKLIAEITFPVSGNVANIDHTFVDGVLRGQGIAGKLVEAAVKQLRAANLKIHPTCSYAVKWFEEHPEHADTLSVPN